MYSQQSPRNGLNESLGASRGTSPNNYGNQVRSSLPSIAPPNYYQPSDIRNSGREKRDEVEQLRDRIHQLEQINDEIHVEIHQLRTSKANNDLPQNTIDNYENRIVMLTTEIQRLQSISGQNDQSKIESENRTVMLSTEIERLKGELAQKNQDLMDANDQCTRLSRDLTTLYDENDRLKRQLLENSREKSPMKDQNLENQVALLTTEIERLTVQNQLKGDEISQLKVEIAQRDAKGNDRQYLLDRISNMQEEIDKLQLNLRGQSEQCDALRGQLARLERANQDDWKSKFITVDSQNSELEKRLSMMMTENDRLSNQVRQLSEESENWKLRYVNMENLIASIPKLEADNTDLTEEVRRLNEQIEQYEQEHEEDICQQDRIKELETQVLLLTNEIERLHFTIRSLYDEIEVQKQVAGNLKNTLQEYTDLDQVNQDLSKLINAARQEADDAQAQYQTISEKFNYFVKKFEAFEKEKDAEVAGLESDLQKLQELLDAEKRENYNLKVEIDQLRRNIPDVGPLERMIAELNSKLKSASNQINKMEEQIQEDKARFEDLRSTHQKCETMRREYSQIVEEKRLLQNQVDALKRERDDLIQKLNALKNDLLDLRNLEQKLIDSENKNSNLLNENNRLNAQLKKRGEELDSALLNLQKYESELQYVRVEADQVPALLAEIERLKQELTDLNFELVKWRNKDKGYLQLLEQYNNLLVKFMLCAAEIEALRKQLSSQPEEEKPKEVKKTVNYHTVNPDTVRSTISSQKL